jgi:hypothetical protein
MNKKKNPNTQELKAIGLLHALAENVVSGSKWSSRELAAEIEKIQLDVAVHDSCRKFEVEFEESAVPSQVTLYSRGDPAEILLDGDSWQYYKLSKKQKNLAIQLFCTYEMDTKKDKVLKDIWAQEHVIFSFPCEKYNENKDIQKKHQIFQKLIKKNYHERVVKTRKLLEKPDDGILIDYTIEQAASITQKQYQDNVVERAISRFNSLAKAENEINPSIARPLEDITLQAYQTFDYLLPNLFTKKYLIPAINLFEMVYAKYDVFKSHSNLASQFKHKYLSTINTLLEGESFYEEGNGKKGFVGLHFDQIRKDLDI